MKPKYQKKLANPQSQGDIKQKPPTPTHTQLYQSEAKRGEWAAIATTVKSEMTVTAEDRMKERQGQ